MKIIVNPKYIGKKLLTKIRTFYGVCKENPKEFLRFEIGMLIGLGMWVIISSVFGIGMFLIALPLGVGTIIFLIIVRVLGIESTALKFWKAVMSMDNIETTFDIFPAMPNLIAEFVEMMTALTEALAHLGKALFANFAIMFPILLDINIDIDWLHVSFAYLVRTFFNIVQFATMYYVFRKIKRKIKDKINLQVEMASKEN